MHRNKCTKNASVTSGPARALPPHGAHAQRLTLQFGTTERSRCKQAPRQEPGPDDQLVFLICLPAQAEKKVHGSRFKHSHEKADTSQGTPPWFCVHWGRHDIRAPTQSPLWFDQLSITLLRPLLACLTFFRVLLPASGLDIKRNRGGFIKYEFEGFSPLAKKG